MSLIRRSTMFIAATLVASASFAFSNISISPETFDFGWCPDNSKINAEFTLRNTSSDLIPIMSVQPTCGCTASQFTPGQLGSNEETKLTLTFNTRGYLGTGFSKSTKIKTETGGATEYSVVLKGFVVNPNAKVFPDNDGVAGFEPGTKEKKKVFNIQNKDASDVTLEIVQAPAPWATVKIPNPGVKAGATTPLEVSVSDSFDKQRETSVTVEAKGGAEPSRFTIAIRTGPPPPPTKRSTQAVSPAPAATPTKPEMKQGK